MSYTEGIQCFEDVALTGQVVVRQLEIAEVIWAGKIAQLD
jgi:hypothetical protein